MIKKLTRHGNSYAILIDKPILELLNMNEETPLSVETDGTSLTIKPVRPDDDKFEEALAKINRNYGRALRKLTK